jgi:hypothetical protein
MHNHHDGHQIERLCHNCKKPIHFDDQFHRRENYHQSVLDCPDCHKHHHSDHVYHEFEKHYDLSPHCPKCSNHNNNCDCIKTCEHPVIFDKRFIVDERFLHHGHFHCDDFCSCDKRFLCDDRFRIRLAGLDGGMAFRLRQLVDCDVKLEVDCENEDEKVTGKICFVGSDFVEILTHKKERKKKVPSKNRLRRRRVKNKLDGKRDFCKEVNRLIPFETIKSVSFDEHGCDCCD